ncbi:MAG: efflux RND transporter permease subunit [Pseudomonadota bacterium]|nr:efflux RND transporter permease subunit [Pseudomonadota bacterium]
MKAAIAWFARNRVAPNLLMALVLLGGVYAVPHLQREVIPELKLQRIQIITAYPGAGPSEVEDGVVAPIEDAIADLEGIKQLVSVSVENLGTVVAEIEPNYDLHQVMNLIDTRVSGLRNLPQDAERPIISELVFSQPVMNLTLYGDVDPRTLKALANNALDEILTLPNVTRAELINVRHDEIAIELSESALQKYGLSFDLVSKLIKASSVDMPAGEIQTETGGVLLRTNAKRRTGDEFEDMELLRAPDGTLVRLADIATVKDGLADGDQEVSFDDKPAVTIQVSRVSGQDVLDITGVIKRYADQLKPRLPEGVSVALWRDSSKLFESRMDTLTKNGLQSMVLVFVSLLLFMRPSVAFWVTHGIVFSFLGTLLVMWLLGISLNMVTLFGFVLVLGTLVDDGVVVGEAIYSEQRVNRKGVQASIIGASLVGWPVLVSVFTNIMTFTPILFLPGVQAQLWAYVPAVVIIAYLVSLVESLFVLPAHLAPLKPIDETVQHRNRLTRMQRRIASSMERFAIERYRPALDRALAWRWVTLSIFVGVLLLTLGLLAGGKIRVNFFPAVTADSVVVDVTLESGSPRSYTEAAVDRIEQALREVVTEAEGSEASIQHVMRSIGQAGGGLGITTETGANTAQMFVELSPAEERSLDVQDLADRWRERIGAVPYLKELKMNFSLNFPGADIEINLMARDKAIVAAASTALQERLRRYPGATEVSDSSRAPRDELNFDLRPEAEALGLTVADVGRQIRQGFFGEEVQRLLRGREEVRVVVRYDEQSRESENSLSGINIRTSDGAAVPLANVTDIVREQSDTLITRVDRRRTTVVSAMIDRNKNDANRVLEDLETNYLPQLMAQYPGLQWGYSGTKREEGEVTGALYAAALIGIALVFAAISILFQSYVQTLLVFTVLPFAVVGAIFAHMVFGITLSMLSMAGIVAALGVCVNDSIVLITYINERRREGMSRDEAIRTAGVQRFRPIVLTTVTTFLGLSPLLTERAAQAQVLIPMAVALSFAVLVTTVICLFLLPVLVSLVWVDVPVDDESEETAA